MKWNFAGDYLINDMLVKAKVGKMPEHGLLDSKYTHESMSIEDVYCAMPDDPTGGGGQCQSDSPNAGAGQKNGEGKGMLDNHFAPEGDGSGDGDANDITDADWRRAIASAAANAKAQGKLPSSMERLVEELLEPKVAWQEILRTKLMRIASRDTITWAKPHRRRLVTQRVVLPSYTGFGAGTVVVAVDTSGSISQKELTVFLTELQNILDVAKPEEVYLIPCDAGVGTVSHLSADDNLAGQKIPLEGGGGTSFRPVFQWVEDNGVEPAALVYFTDMCGSFPEEPPYATIWAATTDREAPFGDTVRIEIADYD
jgi:predicted metal-dependent peptidase